MHIKGFIVIILVFLLIYGVYYLVTEADFLKLISIPRIFDPFATSAPPVRPGIAPRGTAASSSVREPEPQTPTPPQGFAAGDLSLYFGKVELASVRKPDRYGIGGEFAVRVGSSAAESVDVTGWAIESYRGRVAISGAGSQVGPVNHARIVIRPNAQAVFYAAWSPFVKNIELDACTGYLNNTYALSPKLPNNCPRPDRSELVNFPGDCQNFISSLSSCETPSPAELNQFAVTRDAACRAFIDALTYEGCVRKYRDRTDFRSYGWRAWIGTELKFDPSHDRLLLFDANGKLVDEYVY